MGEKGGGAVYQATTPTHTFNLPFFAETISKLVLTYKQKGKVILEKNESDVTLSEKKITLVLTQEETNLFEPDIAFVQLRCKVGDKVMASNLVKIFVWNTFNREVI
jgi:hypothetical protein